LVPVTGRSWPAAGKVTVGLASHWLCVRLKCGLSTYRLTAQTDNHASTTPLSFLQAGCPSCHQTNSVKALQAPQVQILAEKHILNTGKSMNSIKVFKILLSVQAQIFNAFEIMLNLTTTHEFYPIFQSNSESNNYSN